MLKEFRNYIAENNMLEKDSRVLLAVSGGIDSMIMSDLFIKAGYQTGIAHCNFSLRGSDSDLDEDLVRKFAASVNIPFYSIRFDTHGYAEKNGLSVQMAARDLRYNWFEKIRIQNSFDYIAVAHNLNDNIETLLINLTRGTGITGLAGMRPVSGSIIRPLLFATRNEIEEYCKKYRITYREDRSNAEIKYTRNRIRHLIIPELKNINPAIERTLAETLIKLRETDDLLSRFITGIRDAISVADNDKVTFEVLQLHNYLHEKTVLFELFSPFGLSGSQTGDLIDVISGKTGGQLFTSSHRILKNRNKIIILPSGKLSESSYKIFSLEDMDEIPIISSSELIDITDSFVIPDTKATACLDEKEIEYPLLIRKWKDGDFFYPLGMKSKKKISDFLIDIKKSLIEKDKIMVLESGGRIAWVIGERIDNRFRIKSATKRALIIKSIP
ncbi:MAG: tRNA lysidine(34) synthetase TilS [Bacteroidetes bacterium]|nr:tRNA lysidine(34) synthetase TilS [Bacteroidota bacterium]